MASMTSYERVMNRLEGKPVDKIPNMNIVMDFAAQQVGASLGEFVTDYRVLVASKLYCADRFGIDTVSVISDPMREAHGFGAKVVIPQHDTPYAKENLLTDLSKIHDLKPIDPMKDERMLDRIRAVESFKDQVKGKIPIIGWVEGCLAEAADLRDISLVMMDLMLDSNRMTTLFEVIHEQQKMFAKAQVDAGADFIGIGNAAASLVGPKLYEEFCLPFDRAIVQYVHSLGAKAKLHICGNTGPILKLLVEAEADIFDVDHVVDFSKALVAFEGSKTAVNGNLDPVSEMMTATEASIVQATNQRIAVADARTFISGGCEIPAKTPPENLKAMDRALYV